jgi:hypothetical protein
MAMLSKIELKKTFSGLSSIMIVKGGISDFAEVTPDFDVPVTVDSLSMTQDAPTLNHYKVHGLQSDWIVTATPGDFSFSATVPSVAESLVSYFLGGSKAINSSSVNGKSFKGIAANLKSVKLNVGIVLLSEDEENAIIIKKMAIYATPQYENASTTPFAFTLTGSIEIEEGAEGSSGDENIAFLTKSE